MGSGHCRQMDASKNPTRSYDQGHPESNHLEDNAFGEL